jgi:hypothetical protein
VCDAERLADVDSVADCRLQWHRAGGHHLCEGGSLDQLHDHGAPVADVDQVVDRGDARVVESRQRAGFALETGARFEIVVARERQDLESDVATQPRVAGAVDLAHAAHAERGDDLVNTEAGTRRQRHEIGGGSRIIRRCGEHPS